MASHYEREGSPYYWVRFKRADGSWGGKSTGIRVGDTGALRKIHQRIGNETSKEDRLVNDGGSAMLRNWVPAWIVRHYKNEKTGLRAGNAWAHLSSFFKIRNILHPEEVTHGLCHDYIDWRTNKKKCEDEGRKVAKHNTAITEIRILGSIMHEALSQGWIIANPCSDLRVSRGAVKEKRAIEHSEQAIIEEKLKSAKQWMQDSWLVGIKQGCRLMEAKVPMKNINVQQMVIAFVIKGGSIHPAPLHKDLLPMVKRRQDEGAEFLVDIPPSPSNRWKRWFAQNGYEDITYHCLRVTVITRFALANITAEKAMQYIGHCSELVHGIYRKLKPKDVATLGDHL